MRSVRPAMSASWQELILHLSVSNFFQIAYFTSVLSEGEPSVNRRYRGLRVGSEGVKSQLSSTHLPTNCSCRDFCFSPDHCTGSLFIDVVPGLPFCRILKFLP